MGSLAERCLVVIEDFRVLVDSLPATLDLSLMPRPPESAPPLIRCGDRSVAEEAITKLNVGINTEYIQPLTYFLSLAMQSHKSSLVTVYQTFAQLEKEYSNDLPFVPL